jgi:proline iminopeptidase
MGSPLVRFALAVLVTAAVLPGCAPTGAAPSPGPVPPGLSAGPHETVLNGVRHWYRVAGRAPAGAPPVVFLHGGPGQGSVHFAEMAGPALEPSLRMVYFDQRGSGRSDRPADGVYSIPLLVEDVEQLRQALGAPRISLVGQSFGGTLALEYAARYPERVHRLVFVAGLWDTPLQCRLRLRTLAERRPEAYARALADTLRPDGTRRNDCDLEFRGFAGKEEREAYNTEAMYPDPAVRTRMEAVEAANGYRNNGEMGGALFRGGLLGYRFTAPERLTMPVLVVAGRHDGAARPEGLRELAGRLPNATYTEFERSGHFPYLDETDRFAREVSAFLNAPREGARP